MTAGGAQEAALVAVGRDELRVRAAEILARPEFAHARSDDPEQLARMLRDFLARIGALFSWFDDVRVASPVLYWLIVVALVLIAAGLLAHVGWSLRVALRRPATARAAARPSSGATALADQAAELAGRGAWLEAAHRMELASIELLLRRGAIRLARHEANRTLRSRLAAGALRADDRAAFVGLLDRFETAWFRDRTSERALYEDWRALHARLAAEDA